MDSMGYHSLPQERKSLESYRLDLEWTTTFESTISRDQYVGKATSCLFHFYSSKKRRAKVGGLSLFNDSSSQALDFTNTSSLSNEPSNTHLRLLAILAQVLNNTSIEDGTRVWMDVTTAGAVVVAVIKNVALRELCGEFESQDTLFVYSNRDEELQSGNNCFRNLPTKPSNIFPLVSRLFSVILKAL